MWSRSFCYLAPQFPHFVFAIGSVVGIKGFQPTSMLKYMRNSLKTQANDMSVIMKMVCLHYEYMQVGDTLLSSGNVPGGGARLKCENVNDRFDI